jgi:nucleoside-diphosphate-sugar epimerase
MKQNPKLLFIGHGYVSQYFCNNIIEDFSISASINNSKDKYFKTPDNIKLINFREIDAAYLDQYDNIIISVPPYYDMKTDVIIDKFHAYFLARKSAYKLIYLSATSVYGDHEGGEVVETSALKARSKNGLARIACEARYLSLQENKLANIIILRLAAIYGDKRNNISSINNKELTANKLSDRLISRTHVVDICQIIKQIILLPELKNEIFNVCDGSPCSTKVLNDYICEAILRLDKLPANIQNEEHRHSSLALDKKIIINNKMKELLDYNFIFPSYKEGLKQIYKNLNLN